MRTMLAIATHNCHENGRNRFHMLFAVVLYTRVSTSSVYMGVDDTASPHVRGREPNNVGLMGVALHAPAGSTHFI